MGITASKPYIVDEFESEDEIEGVYESAIEYVAAESLLKKEDISDETNFPAQEQLEKHIDVEEIQEKPAASNCSPYTVKGLEDLLKLLEKHDFEGAQRAANLLKLNHEFNNHGSQYEDDASVSLPQSAVSSLVTSTWSSKTDDEVTDTLSGSLPQENGGAEGISDEQRRALAQLDEELNQFETNEEKIANDAHVFHSGIPRLKSAALRSGGGAGIHVDVSRKPHPERRRSPSPHSPSGKLRSGIPRYSWAHVAPLTDSTSSVESKTEQQTLDASCLSNALESLPEMVDKTQTALSKKSLDKPVVSDRSNSNTENSSPENSEDSPGNVFIGTSENSGDTPTWQINMSDRSGRVKMKKKHTGLSSLWTRSDEHQKALKTKSLNESDLDTSASSEMNTEEIVACRTIGECGNPSERKVLDLKRWYCISRPQYKTSSGISAVVSCWNYLFSTMGHGSLKPVTQEAAMKLFGFTSPFDGIDFGPLTGNATVLRWFNELSSHFKVNGAGSIMYKPSGKNQTLDVTDQMALDSVKKGLKDSKTAFIYHCHNHYLCPIGYEDTSQFCVDAYKGDVGGDVDTWVLFGDTSRKYPSIHCKSWEEICQDLNCKSPSYLNIRQNWKGVRQQKNIKTLGENFHCIMAFQKVSKNVLTSSALESSSYSTSSSLLRSTRLPAHQPSHATSQSLPSPGMRSVTDAHRPELGNSFHVSLEDEEVGCENLDSDKSDDDIYESESSLKESET